MGLANGYDPSYHKIAKIVRQEAPDMAREIVAEELAPVVREAITEDTIRALKQLVGLTPTIVEKLAEDIESDDPTIRQKAYTLAAKYTFGHPAIVRPPEETDGQTLNVNFQLPRPGDDVVEADAAVELEASEILQCDKCGEDKPLIQFVAGSHRCIACFEEQQKLAQELADGD